MPDKIIMHCSDSEFASVAEIDRWHRERGFDCVGYHFVITNEMPEKGARMRCLDGQICAGRALSRQGAHTLGYNTDSIGICIVGKNDFTTVQFESAKTLVLELMGTYQIPPERVLGHCELDSKKSCPNFDMDGFREFLEGRVLCSALLRV
jgi:N-acetyl-anhydromuramyl-L-alanine amidase AmpD